MTLEQTKSIYSNHDSEKLFGVLINMSFRKKLRKYDSFNTAEQIENAIASIVEIFSERGIVFQKMEKKKWVDSKFEPNMSYLKIYRETKIKEKTEIIAIGQY